MVLLQNIIVIVLFYITKWKEKFYLEFREIIIDETNKLRWKHGAYYF